MKAPEAKPAAKADEKAGEAKTDEKKETEYRNWFDVSVGGVIVDGDNRNLILSARNVKHVKVLQSEGLNIFDVMKYQNIVFTQDAVRKVEGALQA